MSEMSKLLSVEAVAERTGVSPHTIRTWLKRRKFSHVRLGRRVLVDSGDLAKFIQANRIEAREPSR